MATKTASSFTARSWQTVRSWNTPKRIKVFKYAVWGLSTAMLVSVISAVAHQRATTQQIGRDSSASVLLGPRLKDTVLGMDSFTANELLAEPDSPELKAAQKGYQDRYEAYVERITLLTQNITYGDREREPIKRLQVSLGEYIRLLQNVRDLKSQPGKQQEMINVYRKATTLLDETMLPTLDEISKVNLVEMDRQIRQNNYGANIFGVVVAGSLVIAALVGLQLFLAQRTKRQFNLPLLVATTIAGLFLLHSVLALTHAADSLKVMQEDAFPSLYSMRRARAVSYQANSDESRYLLDKARIAQHQESFTKHVKEIMSFPSGVTLDDIDQAIGSEKRTGKKFNEVTGLIAGAVNNVTFKGEGPALVKALKAWQNYVDIDNKIRDLEKAGKHQEAINLCLGESDDAYGLFKKALDEVQKINEKESDNALAESDRALYGFEIQAAIALVLVALLTQIGLQPRIKEYEV
jgi:tetratricopeptide (TPR) repeat protein